MAIRDCIELEFEGNPSRLLKELGLQTGQFKKIKENILTRLISRPNLAMIVLEFRRAGLFYGEVSYGDTERYQQARKCRGEAIGRAARRDSSGLEEPEVGGDDGVYDSAADQPGRSLEQLLRGQIARRGSQHPSETNGWD